MINLNYSFQLLTRQFNLLTSQFNLQPATETVDLGSIPGQVKPNTIKTGLYSFSAWRSALQGTV